MGYAWPALTVTNFGEKYQNVSYIEVWLIINLQNQLFQIWKISVITFQYWVIYSYGIRNSRTGKQNCLKLLCTWTIIIIILSLLDCLAFTFYHVLTIIIRYIEVYFTFSLVDCVERVITRISLNWGSILYILL